MATSTGPQKADFSRCTLDKNRQPSGSEYGGKPRTATSADRPKSRTVPMSGNVIDERTSRPKDV